MVNGNSENVKLMKNPETYSTYLRFYIDRPDYLN